MKATTRSPLRWICSLLLNSFHWIIKAIVVSLGIYAVMNTALFYFSASWWIILISLIGGVIFLVFSSISGSIKNICDAFIDSVAEVLIGTLHPIDSMHEKWKEASDENLTKKEFFIKVVKEVIMPSVSDKIRKTPFQRKLEETLDKFVESLSEEDVNENEGDDSFLKRTINKIERSSGKAKRIFGKPYHFVLKMGLYFWGILWFLYLINYI